MNGASDFSLIAVEAAVFALGIVVLALDMVYRGSRPAMVRKTAVTGMATNSAYVPHCTSDLRQ